MARTAIDLKTPREEHLCRGISSPCAILSGASLVHHFAGDRYRNPILGFRPARSHINLALGPGGILEEQAGIRLRSQQGKAAKIVYLSKSTGA